MCAHVDTEEQKRKAETGHNRAETVVGHAATHVYIYVADVYVILFLNENVKLALNKLCPTFSCLISLFVCFKSSCLYLLKSKTLNNPAQPCAVL